MDIQKAYEELFDLLLYDGVLDVDERVCNIFINYIKARLIDLGIEDTKVHFFLKEEEMIKTPNGYSTFVKRYDPFTLEPCKKKWPYSTRAFNYDGEIYISFDIMDNYQRKHLEGYNLVNNLIDFIFSLEHELKHTIQKNKSDAKVIDYDTFRYERDMLIIGYLSDKENIQDQSFYYNAHNNLFLEEDANAFASAFLIEQLRKRGIGSVVIHRHGDKKYTIEDVFNNRKNEGKKYHDSLSYEFDMLFGVGKYKENIKVDIEPERIVSLLTDEIISTYPGYIRFFPTFSYVYNKNGKKKTYFEIKELMEKNPELSTFLNKVIENDSFLMIQKLEDEMVRKYTSANNIESKDNILDSYVNEISSIINKETFNIENLLLYYDKRLMQIQKSSESIEYKNTAKLIVLLTKQLLLKENYLKRANVRITELKMNLPTALLVVEEKCQLKISFEESTRIVYYNALSSRIADYKNNHSYWIKKGLSEEEYKQIIEALEICRYFVSRDGYLLNETLVEHEKVRSFAPGTDNLYNTNYYKYKKNELKNNPEELEEFEELFRIADEIFRQCQKHVGLTGEDINSSLYVVLRQNPLISRLLTIHPEIIDLLSDIRDSEEKQEYLTRIDLALFVCKEFVRESNKKTM